MNKMGATVTGIFTLLLGWTVAQPVKAAVTYPITGIQVTAPQTYLTADLNGTGYHLTVKRHQRARLRANLHLKYHQATVWTRREQAYITQHGQRQLYYFVQDAAHQSGWVRASALKMTPPATLHLNVPVLSQLPELPTGCEMTATTMMLQFAGIHVDKMQFAATVPRTGDPNTGFVGDPTSNVGVGLYVYPTGLLSTVKRYLPTAANLSGMSLEQLKAHLVLKRPVVVWVTGLDGFASHTVTMIGYTPTSLTYNDPWTGRTESIDNGHFETIWQQNGRRALSY